jgi:uncharacterized protein (DUF1330 family)
LYFNRVSCDGIAGCGTEGADAIMKTKYTLALAMLAGVGIGAAAVQALHAQTKPPAYAVVELEVQNPDEFKKQFLPLASKVFSEAGGKFLARPGIATAIDGTAPNRVALIAFDSLDKAVATFGSAAYKDARKTGDKYAKFRIFAVEGLAP